MKLAETVTFGGGGLDRAAELRGDSAALEEALRSGDPVVLPVWRGKPLMADHPRGPVPHFVAGDHPILEAAPKSRLFLGRDATGLPPIFRPGNRRIWTPPRWTVSPMPAGRSIPRPPMRRFANCAWRWPNCRRGMPRWRPRPRRCSAGTGRTGSAPAAARKVSLNMADGTGAAGPAVPCISRAPTRW